MVRVMIDRTRITVYPPVVGWWEMSATDEIRRQSDRMASEPVVVMRDAPAAVRIVRGKAGTTRGVDVRQRG